MRPRSPRSSRGQPSHSRFQDLPQPRSGERESIEGHYREHYYRHCDKIRGKNPRITCHNCGEKGHIARQCANQDYRDSRNRDTDFRNNEQHFQSREDDKRSEDRLPESPKMQRYAYRKSLEQSTVGSAKAGFSSSIKEEKIESLKALYSTIVLF